MVVVGSGKVPDQLVGISLKHGVEAKDDKEVRDRVIPAYKGRHSTLKKINIVALSSSG